MKRVKKKYHMIRNRFPRIWMESLEPRELMAASVAVLPVDIQQKPTQIQTVSDLIGVHALNSLPQVDNDLRALQAAQTKRPRHEIGPPSLEPDLDRLVVMVV